MKFYKLLIIGMLCSFTLFSKEKADGLYAEVKTNKGIFVIALEYEKTPVTVANFVGLAEGIIPNSAKKTGEPYFDGTIFHRVINGFMIQGGDPTGTGRGGPGYNFNDEFDPSLKHDKPGVLSMANAGPGTNGSQFFISHQPTPHLDNKHSVFGHIVEGMDVVYAIGKVKKGRSDKPLEDVVMEKVTIIRVGSKAEAFENGSNKAFDEIIAIAKKGIERLKINTEKQEKAKDEKKITNKLVRDEDEKIVTKQFPNSIKAKSGLRYITIKDGKGTAPGKGARVTVHYTGKLLNGTIFDSSVKRNRPFQFNVGTQQVIKGWDEAFLTMKKGEKRTLIIPPELGYGDKGAAGVIPPNAWLIFDVEMIDFK